ncbi:gliding motility-associated C-terminal domain-containing protein [Riemerella columbina]|uniref:T9SS type B sorting domain-containing protein n=1 Tax=Riemerella columbina TaxID=103810 RepID=UPI002670216A|nr:gliding motility-associated C-terminal domain-containing protein [Riemerella columbina]WKS94714.1 gliding motility-associated C-terminal domain-containing protein [Riemerella columbina]
MKKYLSFYFVFVLYIAFGQIINQDQNAPLPAHIYFCDGESFHLKLSDEETNTGDYRITKISNFRPSNGHHLVPFSNKQGNNHFSKPVDIGFNFSFFGEEYSQVVVSSNGRLIFGKGTDFEHLHEAKYVDQVYNGHQSDHHPLPNIIYNQLDSTNPSATFDFAQIFAGFTHFNYYNDYDYNNITYGSIEYDGKRGLIISWSGIIYGESNYADQFSAQVVLFEDNTFVIKVKKSLGQKAILGVQNQDATLFRVEESVHNNQDWESNGADAFSFTPDLHLTPQVEWSLNDTPVSAWQNQTEVHYTPIQNEETLKAQVVFKDHNGNIVGTPKNYVHYFKKLSANPPQIASPEYGTCVNPAMLKIVVPQTDMVYEWYRVGEAQPIGTGTTQAVGNGKYIVKAKSTYGGCSVTSNEMEVNINSIIPPMTFRDQDFKLCDTDFKTEKSFTLAQVVSYPNGANYTVKFYQPDGTEASTATIKSGETKTFKIKVETNAGVTPACATEANFSISYLSLPEQGGVEQKSVCFGVTSFEVADFEVKWRGRGYHFSYSLDGGQTYQTLQYINPAQTPVVKVKINHPDFSCASIVDLKLSFYPEVVANQPSIDPFELQQCASDQSFNLTQYESLINPDPEVMISFYQSLSNAQQGIDAVNKSAFRAGRGVTRLYARVENRQGCVASNFPTIDVKVYSKPHLKKRKIELTNCAGNTVFRLKQDNIALFFDNLDAAITPRVSYYDSQDQPLTEAQIENYDVAILGERPYLKVAFNSTCSEVLVFDLKYHPQPQAAVQEILVCEGTSYPLEDFKKAITNRPEDYDFFDEQMSPLSSDWTWIALPYQAKFYIKDKNTGCLSALQQVDFKQNSSTEVHSAIPVFEQCDTDLDGKTTFNLFDWKPQITADTSAELSFYRDAAHTQLIAQPEAYLNTNLEETIYGVARNPQRCSTPFSFDIKVNLPQEIYGVEDKKPCYGEPLYTEITNAQDFTQIEWMLPDGQTQQGQSLSLDYEHILWGTYKVKVQSQNGCQMEQTFTVSDEQQPKITSISTDDDKIEVSAEGGTPPYTYSFNGVEQASSTLWHPQDSVYEIQVKSATGCWGAPQTVYFLKFNNVITPNGDGKNDTWVVEHLEEMQEVQITITDRYGDTVFSAQSGEPLAWDGKKVGRVLPSATYWYVVKWLDPATQRHETKQGWILLKNQ